jgi:hypothetical protein
MMGTKIKNLISIIAMSIALVALFVALFTDCKAADEPLDLRLGLIIGSDHHDNRYDYNEDNNGIYGCIKGFCAAHYENSYSNTRASGGDTEYSTALYYMGTIGYVGPVEFNWSFGIVNGYKDYDTNHEWKLFPAIGARWALFRVAQYGRATAYGLELTLADLRKWTK